MQQLNMEQEALYFRRHVRSMENKKSPVTEETTLSKPESPYASRNLSEKQW